MLRIFPRSKGNVLAVECSGKLTRKDYTEVLIPKLNDIISEHGKARVMLEFAEDFCGYEVKALFEDARYGLKHASQFEKVAIVNGPSWINVTLKVFDKFSQCKCRAFNKDERDEAWSFIED